VNKLFEIIRFETAQRGVLSFARFMELALYCPNYGYYELQKDNPGQRGDFYTNVSTGELFGQLLAFQFAAWLESELGSRKLKISIVEAGAHDGKLAKDILNWLQLQRPVLFEQIEYCIVEPSKRRQEWQRETLIQFVPQIRWVESLSTIHDSRCSGIIFSNELLDAMPVHRFGWDVKNKKWFEWGVAVEGEKFVWTKIPASDFRFPTSELESVLPDNYTIETSPAAENWWRAAANVLARGRLLTIDYGLTVDELYSPARPRGTLRTYFRHHASDDLLANAGVQDLTAHVNFSVIQAIGEAAGLTTESFSTQPQFLTQILGKAMPDKHFGEWSVRRTRQFQTLTHPEHLGRAFRVLVQSRCINNQS
jgi:SAM-dependent MidA family methyltransferase